MVDIRVLRDCHVVVSQAKAPLFPPLEASSLKCCCCQLWRAPGGTSHLEPDLCIATRRRQPVGCAAQRQRGRMTPDARVPPRLRRNEPSLQASAGHVAGQLLRINQRRRTGRVRDGGSSVCMQHPRSFSPCSLGCSARSQTCSLIRSVHVGASICPAWCARCRCCRCRRLPFAASPLPRYQVCPTPT